LSWHTSAILIHSDLSGDYDGLLARLGLNGGEPREVVPFDDAVSLSNEGVAVGTVDGWTALWGIVPLMMIEDEGLAEIAEEADVFQMLLEGTSDTAGFTWWTGGKAVRDWMRQDGEVCRDEGKPLRQEKKAFTKNSDEQAILQLLMSLTLPLKRLQAIRYQMYEFPEMG
jgi:hypothetical protein